MSQCKFLREKDYYCSLVGVHMQNVSGRVCKLKLGYCIVTLMIDKVTATPAICNLRSFALCPSLITNLYPSRSLAFAALRLLLIAFTSIRSGEQSAVLKRLLRGYFVDRFHVKMPSSNMYFISCYANLFFL